MFLMSGCIGEAHLLCAWGTNHKIFRTNSMTVVNWDHSQMWRNM